MTCCRAGAGRRASGAREARRGAAGESSRAQKVAGCGWVRSPDETRCHRPAGRCACGADLAAAADVRVERSHQVHDLPEVAIKVTQHDVWRVRCGCGREHAGTHPAGVPAAPSSYGAGLKALVVYLIVYQHVPVERCVQLVADLTGGRPARRRGSCTGCWPGARPRWPRWSSSSRPRSRWRRSPGSTRPQSGAAPPGRRNTSCPARPRPRSPTTWAAGTWARFTAFGILPSFAGIAVHDRYACYFHQGWQNIAGHQACCAHLIRDFEDAAESWPDAIWPAQAQRALRGLIRAWHAAREPGAARDPRPRCGTR